MDEHDRERAEQQARSVEVWRAGTSASPDDEVRSGSWYEATGESGSGPRVVR
ncbi:MAG: hypothetical protein HC927_09150, partial [Deltaproteobacteria bacterium]|nr:hypothetical protein [Deltaproteobacteria bacterium]